MQCPVGTERVPSILSAMANPAKRKASDDPSQGKDPAAAGSSSSTTSKPAKVVPPKAKAKAASGPEVVSTRHTPAKTTGKHVGPSPRWVPVLMFALWGVGLLLIILNYMGVLPGAEDGGNGWYLVGGLVSILAGIMVATQYR
jgi:hypothetical protein